MILGLVPARGGSKGLPRKNLRLLGESTLLALAVQCAFRSAAFDRVVVSTEDPEIAREAVKSGAEVLERPERLAQDDTPMLSVVNHAMAEHPEADVIVLLQPTSPLRRPEHVRIALGLLEHGTQKPTSVVSVVAAVSPEWTFGLDVRGLLMSPCRAARRQDLKPAFVRDGTVYAFYSANLGTYGDIYGPRALPFVIPRADSCNVDSEEDLVEAAWKLGRQA